MPTPVEIQVTVDASGALIGSQKAADALNAALAKMKASSESTTGATNKTSTAFNKFTDASHRGISPIYALDAALVQATGGFQSLGLAAPFASGGIRGALFAISEFVNPVTAITVGLAALVTVFSLTAEKSDELSKAIQGNTQTLEKFALQHNTLTKAANELREKGIAELRKEIEKTNATIALYENQIARAAPIQKGFTTDIQAYQEKLLLAKNELLRLTGELQKYQEFNLKTVSSIHAINSATEESAKSMDLQFQLLQKGILADKAKSTSVDQHNTALEKNIQLQIEQQRIVLSQATTPDARALALQREISLINQERAARLKLTMDTVEQANIRVEAENKVLLAQKEFQQLSVQGMRQFQVIMNQVSSIFASNFINAFSNVQNAFKSFIAQMAQLALEFGARSLFAKIFHIGAGFALGGPGGAVAGGLASVSGGGGGLALPSSLASISGGGSSTINVNINTLDRKSMEMAVKEELVPILTGLVGQRKIRLA